MQIDPAILNHDAKSFEDALSVFQSQDGRTMDDSIAAIDSLDKSSELGTNEIARRVRLIVGRSLLPQSDGEKLVVAAARWQPAVKLSIQAALSPAQRQRIYELKSADKAHNIAASLDRKSALDNQDAMHAPQATVSPDSAGKNNFKGEDFRSVLLLGSAEAHEANNRFLEANNFS
ncbi:MAG TPA: hypothetical protein VME24_08195, partial [Alphaproteobacteria bacterium]|nr:hypothetical protein [Alphaproteobacteria bacterium]